jgi:hypothetical protein
MTACFIDFVLPNAWSPQHIVTESRVSKRQLASRSKVPTGAKQLTFIRVQVVDFHP